MGLGATKPVFGGLRSTQAQTSLRIRAVWSAPLLIAYWKVSYIDLLLAKFQYSSYFGSWAGWFEIRIVGNPEDRFSRDEAQLLSGVGDWPSHLYSFQIFKISSRITLRHISKNKDGILNVSQYWLGIFCKWNYWHIFKAVTYRLRAKKGPAPPPPPREFCRHILSWRKFQAASFKRCLHSVLRGVSLWQPDTYVTVTN